MQKSFFTVPLVFVLSGTLSAQDMAMPKPPAEIAKFAPMLGSWTGKGVYREHVGADAQAWTATMTLTSVLDGFAVQEDLVIEMGAPTPLLMRTVYGYDASSATPVAVALSNQGALKAMGYEFHGDNVLVVYGVDRNPGSTGVGRERVEFTKDSYKFTHEGSRGADKHFVEVEGEFTRSKPGSGAVVEASFANMPISAEMKSLSVLNGSYKVAGKMVMAPEMPVMDITGIDAYQPMWGGQIIHEHVTGDSSQGGPSYHSDSYVGWNAVTSSYDWVMFDNMGVAGQMASRWTKPGTEMVASSSMVSMGTLVAQSTVIRVGKQGVESVKSHALFGANDPVVSFDARFTRQ